MNRIFLFFAIVVFVLIIIYFRKSNKNIPKKNKESLKNIKIDTFNNQIDNDLRRKTEYVSLVYGRPNKCFSCEKEVLKNIGPKYIHYAFPTKCFSCEKGSKNPYMEGPTKCFSCDTNKNIY